ncbi:PAS domain-containing protein [Exilibacterium tricleocarpae]|uniref:PAS domain-containing protein n=2 Tax=Exilibacterium tricleocarpae TaxID=2591008 RepID=A0A545U4D5_9GAMM|nr:PAS domain-containing protein [Exilibacterium tricleocarpae]
MLADNNMTIVYMNDQVKSMLRDRERELQGELRDFRVNDLIGKCVDDFHQNPSHQRGMIGRLSEPYNTDLKVAGLTFGLTATPWFDLSGERVGTVIEWEDKTERLAKEEEEQRSAAANLRIKQALDVCDTSVMMADDDLNIIYLNEAVKKMLRNREQEIRSELPTFDVSSLMGYNVDNFHKNPAHQRNMLKGLREPYKTDLQLASLTFNLIATPLFDEQGQRLGTVVEWVDKTDQLAREREEQRIAAENLRIKQALDVCDTSVMMADDDLNIIYLNKAVVEMLRNREQQIRTQLPNFDVNSLLGFNVDGFHKNPSHQRNMLRDLRDAYMTDLPLAGLTFGLIATPLFDEQGRRLGTVVEWVDKTDRLARENEEQRVAAENLRIKQALDVCDTSVMMADNDLNIIYMNKAVVDMLRNREQQIRTQLPNFDVNSLLGFNVDGFHKNPSHQRNMLRDLKDTYMTDLPLAGLTFGLIATPLFDEEGTRLGTVVEWNDKTDRLAREKEEQELSASNARVKQALDNVSANVMIADNDFNIIYLNESVAGMMRAAESDIRKQLTGFDAGKLIGANVDIFHKNPAHQRSMVGAMSSTYRGEIEVGGRTFSLIANPIVVEGDRIGTVVEWNDRTAEVVIEHEIDAVVEAAGAGDFTRQISMEGKEGFFKNLSTGLNTLVSTIEVAMNDVLRMLGAMAKGDLSERITRDYQGSFGQLKNDANDTANKLTEVIGNIRGSATAITSAASEIAQGNADLSQRTEEQASSLEETASSMEQMTSAVKQSAENASQANGLASDAQQKAKEGGEVVSRAVSAMDEINAASKKISDIIGVIDEIAFQTNLLALNAAVEAARAGEQGRGFAVVAGEVRNLAQRSAGAAKEIKDLIRDSVNKVDDGTQLVNQSGETLQEIVAAVEKVSNMMREISDAAQEQTSGIEQVNTAVSQMDEMTQQNAALVEEASAAGESMAEQARSMSGMMDFFTVDENMVTDAAKPSLHVVNQPSSKPSRAAGQGHQPAAGGGDDEWEDF